AVVLFKAVGAPLGVQILAAACASGLLGFGTGLLTLRLRGIFFSIATVAVIFIMHTAIVNWRYVGGATGVQLLRPPAMPLFDSYTRMLFVVMAVLAVAGVCIARYIEVSWIGRGGRAAADVHELPRAGVQLRPQLFGIGARHADDRRHLALAGAGDRRDPARLGPADRHRDDLERNQRAGGRRAAGGVRGSRAGRRARPAQEAKVAPPLP